MVLHSLSPSLKGMRTQGYHSPLKNCPEEVAKANLFLLYFYFSIPLFSHCLFFPNFYPFHRVTIPHWLREMNKGLPVLSPPWELPEGSSNGEFVFDFLVFISPLPSFLTTGISLELLPCPSLLSPVFLKGNKSLSMPSPHQELPIWGSNDEFFCFLVFLIHSIYLLLHIFNSFSSLSTVMPSLTHSKIGTRFCQCNLPSRISNQSQWWWVYFWFYFCLV